MILVDSDVLIWYLRGNIHAVRVLERLQVFSMSSVTYIDLVQGMRSKNELRILRKAISDWHVEIKHIDYSISARAMYYVEEYFLSHCLRLADALIAATAIEHGIELMTGNDKHYKVIHELQLKKFKAA